ncbi:MAG: hypothetical protein P4L56_14675 [Candidatus Sulfopaludibacter sp.]|nr:hypothetical protein [Candidatus Sulfopaludibacter sp.]
MSDIPPWDWPESAAADIQKVLADRRAAEPDRIAAAEFAGDLVVMSDNLAEALLAIVRHPSEPEELRARAAISFGPVLEQADMGGFEDPDDSPVSEEMFARIRDSLREIFQDEKVPKEVRRRCLEASVRAPGAWLAAAIRKAYAGGDREWVLTAVFAMGQVDGFDASIIESLENPDPEIHWEAVRASSARALDGAWSHVVALVQDADTPKDLLLVAIDAVGNIRPEEAEAILSELAESEDEDIAEAAKVAMATGDFEDDEDEEEDF